MIPQTLCRIQFIETVIGPSTSSDFAVAFHQFYHLFLFSCSSVKLVLLLGSFIKTTKLCISDLQPPNASVILGDFDARSSLAS